MSLRRSTLALFALAAALAIGSSAPAAARAGLPAAALPPIDGPAGKIRWAYYVPYAANSFESLRQNAGSISHLSPYWYGLDGEGNLTGGDEFSDRNREGVIQIARNNRIRVLPLVKNTATFADFHPVLADPELRAKAIAQMVQMVVLGNFDGINIDFEGVDAADRPHLTAFMAELAPALRSRGRLVTQAVPAKDQERLTGWAGAYDYLALAPHNDLVVLMTYGYGNQVPQSTAPMPWVERSAAYAASQIPAEKLLLGLAWYGYDWNITAGGVRALRWSEAVERLQSFGAALQYDERLQTPHFTYSADGQDHEVWFEDARSNDAKMDLVFKFGLAGAAAWRMGHEDPGVWTSYRDRLGFRTWYLAEGCTCDPFHTWVLVQNPNGFAVTVTFTFMKEDGTSVVRVWTVLPLARFSVFVNDVVPKAAFATKVEAAAAILVERAMYFGADGHNSAGLNAPARRWLIPEGSSSGGIDTWVLLLNPNPTPSTARLTFMKPDGTTVQREFMLRPTSRLNVYANQHVPNSSFSTLVEADGPVVAERASYGRAAPGSGNGSPASFLAAQRWYLAEGFTGHAVSLALMNPGPSPAQAAITYMLDGSSNVRRTVSLRPFSRLTVVPNEVLPQNTAFSTLVESDQPIAVERTSQAPGQGSHSALGVTTPLHTWFLAEGSTAGPFRDYVLLQNPNPVVTTARVAVMTDAGRTVTREYVLAPQSRFTVDAASLAPGAALSVRVDSVYPLVVERAMYFGNGSHASAGIGQ